MIIYVFIACTLDFSLGFESNLNIYPFLRVQYISLSLKGAWVDYEKIQTRNWSYHNLKNLLGENWAAKTAK